MNPPSLICPLFLTLTLAVGCSGPVEKPVPELVPVNGKLSVKGEPVPNVSVIFLPEEGDDARGITNAEGHYELKYRGMHAGAPIAKYRVQFDIADADAPLDVLPARYRSGAVNELTADVTADGPNKFDFDLK